jgi:hypothetical protein
LVATALENCVNSVNRWCGSKRLQLNTRKTEVLWFGSHRNLEKLTPDVKKLHIGSEVIMPTEVVRDLGIYFDSEMNKKSHISKTCTRVHVSTIFVVCELSAIAFVSSLVTSDGNSPVTATASVRNN